MKWTCFLLLLTIVAVGCGYSSKGGTMAAGAPAISQLMPNSTPAGGAAFTLTVNGSNFVSGATVYWNANARPTTFVSVNMVKASVMAADIAMAQTALVYVKNPGGSGSYGNQGGQSSTTVDFTVSP